MEEVREQAHAIGAGLDKAGDAAAGAVGTRRHGGRSQRRAERGDAAHSRNTHLRVPYIQRNIPTYDLLSEASLDRLDATTDRILAEIGFEFRDDAETIALFGDAGAQVEAVEKDIWRLRFPPGMIRDILGSAPPQFTQHARNPQNSVEIGGRNTVFAPAYGSPFIVDASGMRRYAMLDDFQNLVRLGQSSPYLHHSGGTICEPTDIPVNKRHLDMIYSHITLSERAFLGSVTAPERAADSVQMMRILFGSDFVEQNCVIMGNFNVTSPLVFDGVTTRGIRTYAAANQGCVIVPFLLGGAVAPVTMAGAVCQNMAESMVGAALTQLVRPGAPVVLGSFVSSLNMRSGSPTFGTPEPALASLVIGQLARRLNVPLRCSGNFSTSKLPDAQAMHQALMSMMAAVQCGANFILHSAGFLDGLLSMSYEKFVLDADLCGALHAYCKGVEVDDETMAFEALAEGGPGVHMFGAQHTLRHYETAFWDSDLNDDQTWETWSETGGLDSMARATALWQSQLANFRPPALDPAVDAGLQEFIAARKDSMPDMWH